MNFLHSELNLSSGDIVVVDLDKQANVRLLDNANFSKYKRGESHSYFGGHATKSPIRIVVPHAGIWNVVVDLGGYSGTVKASIRTEKA